MIKRFVLIVLFFLVPSTAFANFAIFQASLPTSGFTTFQATSAGATGLCDAGDPETCIVYVSSSTGNDATCSLQPQPDTPTPTPSTVCATIHKATSLIRNNKPDWVLLKTGDTFTNDTFSTQSLNGGTFSVSPSWSTPGSHTVTGVMLFGYYGSQSFGRPTIQVAATSFGTNNNNYINVAGTNTLNSVAFDGWNFYAYTRDPNNGSFSGTDSATNFSAVTVASSGCTPCNNVIFEDNKFSYFGGSFSYSPSSPAVYGDGSTERLKNFVFRRNIVAFNYNQNTVAHAQGMYLEGLDTFALIEDNYMVHNGWLPTSPSVPNTGPNVFNHNFYFASFNTGNFVIRGNVITDEAGGTEFRNGGTIFDNFWVNCQPCMFAGQSQVSMTYDVIQFATALSSVGCGGQGFELTVAQPGSTLDHDIISNEDPAYQNQGCDYPVLLDAPTHTLFNGDPDYVLVGSFTSGSNAITVTGGSAAGAQSFLWAPGTAITNSGTTTAIPADTTITTISCPGSGSPCTGTMSNNALATQSNAAIAIYNVNQTVSNSIGYTQFCSDSPLGATCSGTGGTTNGIFDNGTTTTKTATCYDPAGANNNPLGHCPNEPFPAPTRTIQSYDSAVLGGPGTLADYENLILDQRQSNWNPALMANSVNNYFRAGFNFPTQ